MFKQKKKKFPQIYHKKVKKKKKANALLPVLEATNKNGFYKYHSP